MPEHKWKLKNKKYCTLCPMARVDPSLSPKKDVYGCAMEFYIRVPLEKGSQKKRSIACVRKLGK